MTALAKLSLLFLGGVFIGLVMPLGFGPSKPTPQPDDARTSADRTVTVHCIVEYRSGEANRTGFAGRVLPRPRQGQSPAHPVEIVVQPRGEGVVTSADGVTVILRVSPHTTDQEEPANPPERPMPGAM
jgi:hypothetical protein